MRHLNITILLIVVPSPKPGGKVSTDGSFYGWNSWHRPLFAGLKHFYRLDCYTFLLSGLD